jgi:hypothetical protein
MQVLSASHVSLDPSLELCFASGTLTMLKALQGDRLPKSSIPLGILGQGLYFHKVFYDE